MNRFISFVLLCSLISAPIAAEVYPIKRVDEIFTINDVPTSKNDVKRILLESCNENVIEAIHQGNVKVNWGGAMTFVGISGAGVGFGLGIYTDQFGNSYYKPERRYSAIVTAGGIIVILVGLAIYSMGSDQRESAVDIYNEQVADQTQLGVVFRF